tara:strand:+ start:520 stop:726 length:207 start_codon:yes stop_codon:yes gene_type:complete
MKIYIVEDIDREYTTIFTSIRKAKKYFNTDKENFKFYSRDIPVNRQGIFQAVLEGADIGGNEISGEFD